MLRTFLLAHLPFASFLVHLRRAHLPAESWHLPPTVCPGVCAMWHGVRPEGQPDGLYIGRHVVPRASNGMHMTSMLVSERLAPLMRKSQPDAHQGGGGGGNGGGAKPTTNVV